MGPDTFSPLDASGQAWSATPPPVLRYAAVGSLLGSAGRIYFDLVTTFRVMQLTGAVEREIDLSFIQDMKQNSIVNLQNGDLWTQSGVNLKDVSKPKTNTLENKRQVIKY